MSKKRTRSDTKIDQKSVIQAELQRRVFLIKTALFEEKNLYFFTLRHPGTERKSYYHHCVKSNKLFQLIQFKESNRCFFVEQNISSNGTIYITVPFDITFLFLYYIRKNCETKALSIDQIKDTDYPELPTVLEKFVSEELMEKISDVKKSQADLYFKYNKNKSLAFLAVKTKRLAEDLFNNKTIFVESSGSISSNYAKSEILNQTNPNDFLQQACDIVGTYLTKDLRLELMAYLSISVTTGSGKRKNDKSEEQNKKKFKSGTVEYKEELQSPPLLPAIKKEKQPGAKELKFAKAAAGTKSIASFFKK